MNEKGKILGSLLLILAVMGYTVFNYVSGNTTLGYFLAYMAVLSFPLVGILSNLFRK